MTHSLTLSLLLLLSFFLLISAFLFSSVSVSFSPHRQTYKAERERQRNNNGSFYEMGWSVFGAAAGFVGWDNGECTEGPDLGN